MAETDTHWTVDLASSASQSDAQLAPIQFATAVTTERQTGSDQSPGGLNQKKKRDNEQGESEEREQGEAERKRVREE